MIDRAAIVAEAASWLGTPYRHQASLKGVGCDCLGLVRGVWRVAVGAEPEVAGGYSADWAEAGRGDRLLEAARRWLAEAPVAEAGPSDVMLFRWRDGLPAKHAAILVEAGRFVHAYQGRAVATAVFSPWWRRRCAGAFRFPGVTD